MSAPAPENQRRGVDAYWAKQMSSETSAIPAVIAHPDDTISAHMTKIDAYWADRMGS